MDIRTITVTDCQPARRKDGTIIEGEGTYGPWTLHDIQATDDTGLPIQERLKCFKPLPLGEPIQIEFDAQHHEQYGTSYTLKPLKGTKLPAVSYANDSIEMVRDSVRLLLERVAALEAHLGLSITKAVSDVPAVIEPPVSVGAASAASTSDDIPF